MAEIEKELDFEIIKEPWTKYKLDDGTIFRLKNPILKAFKTTKVDNLGNPTYRVGGISLISVTVQPELKGTPSENQTIEPADIISEMKLSTICEDWCEYQLSDGAIFRSKIIVIKISKSNKYNSDSEPIYTCNWQALTDKIDKK